MQTGPFYPYANGLETFDFDLTRKVLNEIGNVRKPVDDERDEKWDHIFAKESWITTKLLQRYGIEDQGLHYYPYATPKLISVATGQILENAPGPLQLILYIRPNGDDELETIQLGGEGISGLQTGARNIKKVKPIIK